MKRITGMCLALGFLLAAGCASIQYASDQAAGADFSAYTTFALLPPPDASEGLPGYSAIEGDRIQQAVQESFVARGYGLSEREEADLLVAFTVHGEPRKDIWTDRTFGTPYSQATAFTTHYIKGTLTIDVYDIAERKLVWHGYATKEFFEDQVGKGDAVEAARGIVKRFPKQG